MGPNELFNIGGPVPQPSWRQVSRSLDAYIGQLIDLRLIVTRSTSQAHVGLDHLRITTSW